MNETPSPFSTHNPKLQLAWDSTSLKALQACPRMYQLSIIKGWRKPGSVDLDFGGFFASSCEVFNKARVEGKSRDEAQLLAVKHVIEASWTEEGPWGGHYAEQWRCLGETKYKNAKGNAAKCPWSHKGKWHPTERPETCGECGSGTEAKLRYLPNDKVKNRHTLVRLVVWYCDEQPEDLSSGLHTLRFESGKAASELSFKMPLPWKTEEGETFLLCGHLDSIKTNGDETFLADNKTTKSFLGPSYYNQFSPNTQMEIYDFAGNMLFPDLKLRGLLIESAQVMVEGARFGAHIVYRDDTQREEFYHELEWWLRQAERFAKDDYWPMNRVNCKLCAFNTICSKPPAQREMWLKADYEVRHWNPLEER